MELKVKPNNITKPPPQYWGIRYMELKEHISRNLYIEPPVMNESVTWS